MKDLKIRLEKERSFLEEKLAEVTSVIDASPSGALHCERRGADIRYFLCDSTAEDFPEKQRGVYIRKDDLDLAKALAQKKYCERLKDELEREIRLFTKIIDIYEQRPLEKIYQSVNFYRKQLIEPVFPPVEDTVNRWFTKYQTKRISEGEESLMTNNGRMVRTRSERMIANELFRLGVPYKYECCLKFPQNGRPVYPAFTVLNLRTGEEYYWEHLELSPEKPLSESLLWRLNLYENEGVTTETKLILTYETSYSPLPLRIITEKIEEYLI